MGGGRGKVKPCFEVGVVHTHFFGRVFFYSRVRPLRDGSKGEGDMDGVGGGASVGVWS